MNEPAFLFDLDDTLYDHQFACVRGLKALQRHNPSLRREPVLQLRSEYNAWMDRLHPLTLAGRLSQEEARAEQIRRMFLDHGERITLAEARRRASRYREGYLTAERGVPGAAEVLRALARRGHPVAVVTNNAVRDQRRKLRACGAAPYVRSMIISQAVGFSKPDPRIFACALRRIGADPRTTTMVGDSFRNDVVGARGAGLRAVWFNPVGTPPPRGPRVEELTSFRPSRRALATLLG